MLGCQDFCGYYDWTFHYVGRRFGPDAVKKLWAEAIGGESQAHYAQAGREKGLRGLYNTWTRTGEDEHCDWTFTLDEERNALRWDMRRCPSKGFLLGNDLNASEDYCDHCMGWMGPLLNEIGVEVVAHEHNHCGQCWGEMRMKNAPHQFIEVGNDIRKDPRWRQGFLDTWKDGIKLPILSGADQREVDSCDVIEARFASAGRIVLCDQAKSLSSITARPGDMLLVTDSVYCEDSSGAQPHAVFITDQPASLPELARRFRARPVSQRPLLLHPFFPGTPPIAFDEYELPRPVPMLPLLIRKRHYHHRPGTALPTVREMLLLLAAAIGKPFIVAEE